MNLTLVIESENFGCDHGEHIIDVDTLCSNFVLHIYGPLDMKLVTSRPFHTDGSCNKTHSRGTSFRLLPGDIQAILNAFEYSVTQVVKGDNRQSGTFYHKGNLDASNYTSGNNNSVQPLQKEGYTLSVNVSGNGIKVAPKK